MNRRLNASAASAILLTLVIGHILKWDDFGGNATGTVVAAEVRKSPPKEKPLSDPELAYQTLANPDATEMQWVEAARELVKPLAAASDQQKSRSLVGERLRSGKQPTVSQLLTQRAEQLTQSHSMRSRLWLTCCLTEWDLQAARPIIRRYVSKVRSLPDEVLFCQEGELCQLMMAGIDAGDTNLIEEYATWMEQLQPGSIPLISMPGIFRPIGRYPNHPRIQQLAERLFSEGSVWLPLLPAVVDRNHRNCDDLIASPLVCSPAFRTMLGRMLQDQTVIGTCEVDAKGHSALRLIYCNTSVVSSMTNVENPDDRQSTEEKPLRVCDVTAWKLSGLPGAPGFEPHWPETRKTEALPLIREFLEQWGHAFRDRGIVFNQRHHDHRPASYFLPPLDHVATLDDVASGRAIFSQDLPGARVRTVALSTYPQPARLKRHALPGTTIHPRPHDCQLGGLDSGFIFQAEEILVNGRWQRFYGFCGVHTLAKVPAAEIELVK